MSNYVQERYKPFQIGVNSTTICPSDGLGGFLALTAGTITITTNAVTPDTPRPIVTALTVVAGQWYPLPFSASHNGMIVTTAGGASGVLGVA